MSLETIHVHKCIVIHNQDGSVGKNDPIANDKTYKIEADFSKKTYGV